MLLARADGFAQRFYSMSSQIRQERKGYYTILESTQEGDLDITDWMLWFLNCLKNAMQKSDKTLSKVLFKHQFWNRNVKTAFNDRQVKLLHLLIDDFKGKLTTRKWAKIAKCSTDTALRDIHDLVQKKILMKDPEAGGRSTNYLLVVE